jgi:hypothetical protein
VKLVLLEGHDPGLDVEVATELLPHDVDVAAEDEVRPVGGLPVRLAALAPLPFERRPETGSSVSDQVANGGTAVGALCFLVASLLLMREAERRAALAQ